MAVKGRADDLHFGDALCLALVPLWVTPVQIKEEDHQGRNLLIVLHQPTMLQNAHW